MHLIYNFITNNVLWLHDFKILGRSSKSRAFFWVSGLFGWLDDIVKAAVEQMDGTKRWRVIEEI